MYTQSFSCVWLCVTPRTVAHQAPLSAGFSRQEPWSGLPLATPGDRPHPGMEPMPLVLVSPLGRQMLYHRAPWEAPSVVSRSMWSIPRPPRWFSAKPGDKSLTPGAVRFSGGGNGNPLQYSCLGNPMDGGAWRATVHGVTKNQTDAEHRANSSWLRMLWQLQVNSEATQPHICFKRSFS